MMSGGFGIRWLADSLPASAILGVVELDAHGEELLADGIGAGEVSAFPGGLPLGDQAPDLGVNGLGKLDDVEDAVRMAENRHRRGALLGRRLSRVQLGIELLDEVEQMPDGGRQIEVIAKRIVPTLACGVRCAPTLPSPRGGGRRSGSAQGGGSFWRRGRYRPQAD